jgi:hypothetical protein
MSNKGGTSMISRQSTHFEEATAGFFGSVRLISQNVWRIPFEISRDKSPTFQTAICLE